jgi:hypothetical protein
MTLPLNTLTIAHQNGDQHFGLDEGGYAIDGAGITISVLTDNLAQDGYPHHAHFCISGHPLEHELRAGDRFTCQGGLDLDPSAAIKAFAYFGFHADTVFVAWTIVAVREGEIEVELESRHDDVDYYDDRAEPTPTLGRFILGVKPRAELWVPEW